ncbi:MAG: hypothetical protein KF724_03120 [Phycisphaeraceae bacterium]|nr:hypothetical protein [Phycisphaeraceae bacterium]
MPLPPEVRREVTAPTGGEPGTLVDPARITRLAVPEPPGRVALLPPVVHRVAGSAEQVPIDRERFERTTAAIDRGLTWLRSVQGPNGGWMEGTAGAGTDQVRPSFAASLAITGLVIKAFAQNGIDVESDPALARAIEYLRRRAWPDGTFDPDSSGALGNYAASAMTMGLASVGSARTREWVVEMVTWLKSKQWDQAQGIGPDRDWFGGAGYGNSRRPDLSNTQFFLDALRDAGVDATDPSVQKALIFVTRCQNLPEFNSAAWAEDGSRDGGMVYTPANGGESMASGAAGEGRAGEKLPPGQPRSLRSYGSMTYAGFKSLLHAGLTEDDPRVRSALEWISRHWTFKENPGMGLEGHYYYLHAMARALRASGQRMITDSSGTEHDWRDELIDTIVGMQSADGSFRNSAERWMEANPELATAYLLLALQEAIKPTLVMEP